MGTSPTLGGVWEKLSPWIRGSGESRGGMVGDSKLIIPLCPLGTSPTLGEELGIKNFPTWLRRGDT